MKCFITDTGSFLPGPAIDNDTMQRYIGELDGETKIKRQVLTMNGIRSRHYALQEDQTPTHDVYQMAALAVEACLENATYSTPISYLSAGSTYTPLSGPGISSILHDRLAQRQKLPYPLEVNSNSGICTSAATAFINAYRAIRTGEHATALCVGTEQASHALKSTAIQPEYDLETMEADLKQSEWFKAVFLRFMLSDGAGACLLQNDNENVSGRPSFEVNWTFSQSFAHEAPLCMKMENRHERLTQDVNILSKYLFTCAKKFVRAALARHDETLDQYQAILPHMSSFFFQRRMERIMREFTQDPSQPVPYWTNLATAGNTGAASIFLMLDEYRRTQSPQPGERILLFVPESGQFNFVLISLTAAGG